MKALLLVALTALCIQLNAQSNKGKEFWVGYGNNVLFTTNVNPGGTNSQSLVLYLSAEAAATVTVSVNGTSYSKTYNVPANGVIQTDTIPKRGPNDARLTAEGLSNRGIHIVADTPIVAYAHQYGSVSSGATMLMPVETYGYTYYSLNYTQRTNITPSYSWFFIVASEDNTRVTITPSATTAGGHQAGTSFNVDLNKGQIYNVFGASTGTTGNDMTGSKIKSIAGADGQCHPVGVFSGASRMVICGNSGDVMQQQIFPASAWGINYLTYPSVRSDSISALNTNYFRVAVRDPTTVVKRNGVTLTGLTNNFYYEYASNTPDFIQADKPVLVAQYLPSSQNCNVYQGDGDPEMFYLSPLEQSIDRAAFFNTSNQAILENYVVAIVPTPGVGSMRIDGSSAFNYTLPHPQLNAYTVVVKALTTGQHTIVCDSSFVAMTYGFGNAESYGYNAGTQVVNLDIVPAVQNNQGNIRNNTVSCPNIPFKLIVQMPYRPTVLTWKFSQVPNFSSPVDTTLINPVPSDSATIGSARYYTYKLPKDYWFSTTGVFNIPIVITSPEIDNCNNTITITQFNVTVKQGPKPDFSYSYLTCKSDTATFTATGSAGYTIYQYLWTFDDNTTSTSQPATKVFSSTGSHAVHLHVVSTIGCVGDTTKTVVTNPNPVATFGIAPASACAGSTITFTDTSSFAGTLNSWYWDFGNGQTDTVNSNAPVTQTYLTGGHYTVKHLAHSAGSCASDTAIKTVRIWAKPSANFGMPVGCASAGAITFSDSSAVADGQQLNYSWNFGDPNATGGNPNTSTAQNPTHTYTANGNYTVTLVVTTANGCSDTVQKTLFINPKPTAAFSINNPGQCVYNNSYSFTNTSTISTGTFTSEWSFGDGGTATSFNATHSYVASGIYPVKLVITSNIGCKDSVTQNVSVYPKPAASFLINSTAQCVNTNAFSFTNTSTITSGTLTFLWSFGNGATSTAVSPTYTYPLAGTYVVKLMVTSNNGCKDSTTQTVTVYPKPTAGFTVNNATQCFSGNGFSFTNTSTISNGTLTYSWNFGNGVTSMATNPSYSYPTAGTYVVTLVATSNNGCSDTAKRTVTITPGPVAGFTINNPNQCVTGNSFTFTSTSTITSGALTYLWNFGNGATSTATNPTYSYPTAGTYIVKLVVSSNNGCKDSTTQTVTVSSKPTASFTINNTTQCLNGNSFTFTNTSTATAGTLTYVWNFGNGVTSTATNPTYSYPAAGTYVVRLVVSASGGCVDSTTRTITVVPKPTAAFTVNSAAAQCVNGNSFTFTNTSTSAAGTLSYVWSFGDGGTSTAASPVYTYATAGTYIVKLVATSTNGCKDSVTQTLTVYPKPLAAFSINSTTQCLNGNSFVFTNSSSVSTGTLTYLWSFGDGNTSAATNPTYAYAAAGTYIVKLVVTTNNGCKDSTTHSVVVNPKPTAAFTINNPTQCLNGNSFSFTNTSTISAGGLNYSWSFGDGGTSTATNPTHSYTAAGTYVVKLVATSGSGCKDSVTHTVTVTPKPTVSFTVNSAGQCFSGNSFVFTNASSISPGTLSYAWSFGDGATSTSTNPTHSYAATGTFTVKLVATSNGGCKDSTTLTVRVYPEPSASFTVDNGTQCLRGNSFSFTNTSTVSTGTLSSSWTFGDGGASTASNPSHVYASAGTYIVTLIVSPGTGCTDTARQTITVAPQPVAAFTVNDSSQCVNNNSFHFINASTVSSGSESYQWSFGDGGTSIGTSPFHTYNTAGTYTVKLVATSNNGCKDSTTRTITVEPKPTASFTSNASSGCAGSNGFRFTNTSTVGNGTLTYQWSFGDGGTSTATSPSHSYAAEGIYIVTLVATSNNGCVDSAIQTITINPMPAASFTVNDTAQCLAGNSFTFNNTSSVTAGTLSFQWSFGDGNTSTATSPSHTYAAAGTYTVRLIIVTNNGCRDTAIKTITVDPKPVASFTANASAGCAVNNNFNFTNTSSIAGGSVRYLWNFGDGDTSTAISPLHHYLTAGTFVVTLVATSDKGCTDTARKTITIYPKPTAGFTINDTAQCVNSNSFTFTNTSAISSGTMTYQWSFGDGGTSTATDPTHAYTAAGTYNVKLIVVTGNGCRDSVTHTITVEPKPVPAFTINDRTQCLNGNNFIITNTSSVSAGTLTYQWSFGDGATSTATNPTHSYSNAGGYVIKVIVTSNNGCKDSLSRTVTIYPQPNAAYTVNSSSQCVTGNSFLFTNTSSVSTGTLTYHWTFGDGDTSAAANPAHVYSSAGTYVVMLIVTSNNGCEDSATQTITVNLKPAAGFIVNSASQCLNGNSFVFTNTSSVSSGTLTYQWSFGDGGTSTGINPAHTYASAGTYVVKLVVTSNHGCKDSTSTTIHVDPKPVPSYTVNDSTQCLNGNNFVFTNTSTVASGAITYLWSFGDGGTSAATNPSHSYTSAGTYAVKLMASSANGCKDSIVHIMTVYARPTAAFTVPTAVQCLNGNSFTFTNSSSISGGSLTYQWSFGDGGTSTASNPTHVYAAAGTYIVTLVATSNNGCKDSVAHTVTINPKPVAAFTINDTAQCVNGNSFSFTNTSSISTGSLTYLWSFGDGGTSTATNPSHSFAAAGTYIVKLVGTSAAGCKDSITHIIIVQPKPSVSFIVNDAQQCLRGNHFQFTTTSTINAGTLSHFWNFGDGSTSINSSPAHVYASAGTYVVKLVVTSNNGCKDSITKTVVVDPQPTASFTVNATTQCVSGNSFSFANTSSIPSGTLSYQWNFGDGGTSTDASPSHTYAAAGTFTVILIATSDASCKDTTRQTVTVSARPVVAFTINDTTQCLSGNNFTFANASTIVTGTLTYVWSFGDGGSSTATNPSHAFAAAGTYIVKLVATSAAGCKDSIQHSVTIYPKPHASFVINDTTQCVNGNSYSFTNTSTVGNGTLASVWSFGDGATSTTTSPTHNYANSGTYLVKLVVTSFSGCKDSTSKTITVYPKPNPAFTVNAAAQCVSGNSFSFTNTSAISSGTMTFQWSFGNGSTSIATNPVYSYAAAGTYVVKLTVTSNNGCKDSVTRTITVAAKPTASFTINTAGQCLRGNSFTFTNTSTGTGTLTYQWKFGDGGISTGANPSHIYTTAGTYIVKLIVTSAGGCKDSIAHTATVYPQPAASFNVNDATQCVDVNSFAFTNTSAISSGTLNYAWNFGDSTAATATSPTHIYPHPGNFGVKLIATSANGCKDSITKAMTVYPNAVVLEDDSVYTCNGDSAVFRIRYPVVGATYNWYSTPTGGSPIASGVTFTVPNVTGEVHYYVKALSPEGCSSIGRAMVTALLLQQLSSPVVSVDSALTTSNSLTFTWTPVSGASGYEVSVDGGAYITPSSGAMGLSHTITGLAPLQKVKLSVRAVGVPACTTSEAAAASATTAAQAIFIPNTFTPNGDGHNDYLRVYCNALKSVTLAVFNQWGQKVSESNDALKGWDGTFNGKPQPVGVYVYVATITLTDGKVVVKHGSVNLIR